MGEEGEITGRKPTAMDRILGFEDKRHEKLDITDRKDGKERD